MNLFLKAVNSNNNTTTKKTIDYWHVKSIDSTISISTLGYLLANSKSSLTKINVRNSTIQRV